jgi:hypothetical protein
MATKSRPETLRRQMTDRLRVDATDPIERKASCDVTAHDPIPALPLALRSDIGISVE